MLQVPYLQIGYLNTHAFLLAKLDKKQQNVVLELSPLSLLQSFSSFLGLLEVS